jgi:hypothetical protein
MDSRGAAFWAKIERENRELKAMNQILAEKVVELEDLVSELREAKRVDSEEARVSQASPVPGKKC